MLGNLYSQFDIMVNTLDIHQLHSPRLKPVPESDDDVPMAPAILVVLLHHFPVHGSRAESTKEVVDGLERHISDLWFCQY